MVKDGVVENVCNWDGLVSTWQPPEGVEMVLAQDQTGVGWRWDGEQFLPPLPVEE